MVTTFFEVDIMLKKMNIIEPVLPDLKKDATKYLKAVCNVMQ